jgi:hypothetical protein
LDYYVIPANYTDAGRILGLFEFRNTVEAALLAAPLLYFSLVLVPLDLTWRLIVGITLAVPFGGFALTGVYGDCLSRFLRILIQWSLNRKNLLYRR